MPTSPTDPSTRLVFVDETGAPGRWLLLDGHGVAGRGNGAAPIPPAARTVLAVPGDQVAIHWLDLGEGLAPAQAAAAARLRLADASAEPLAGMHVAVGRAERGLAPAALVPAGRMQQWLAAASAAGLDADAVVPAPLLLVAPETGFHRRDHGALADYRGPHAAFAIEPELAGAVVGDAPTQAIGDAAFESRLGPLVADPLLDLRQGPFARRRPWAVDHGRMRRITLFALALALLSLVVQVATILAYTFAADRAEAEVQALAGSAGRAAGDSGPGFGAAASVLFEAIRATPNAELARIDYRADGSLVATVTADNPATLQALQGRLEASGLTVAAGQPSNAGGRLTADLTMRAG